MADLNTILHLILVVLAIILAYRYKNENKIISCIWILVGLLQEILFVADIVKLLTR